MAQYYFYAENSLAGIFSPQRAEKEFYTIRLYPSPQAGEITINEFLADNKSDVKNEYHLSEDWIELLAELARLATEREGTDKYAILRLKQWLSFRNMKYPTPCFQQIKLLQEISSFYDLISGNSHLAFDSVDQQDSSRRLDVALQSSL
jgi:hypothetical protein